MANAHINRDYEDLLDRVLRDGERTDDRTGVGTRKIFGAQMRFNLREGFPLITTKKMFLRGVVEELRWMLSGDNRVSTLRDNGVNIWNEWALEDDTIGPGYGYQWRHWPTKDGGEIDQISELVEGLRKNPYSRRHIVSAWNVEYIDSMALPPCHMTFQFDVSPSGRLSCQLYQRSADLFLGVPFNIAFYSLLTHMLAQQVELKVGDFIWTGGDCHIYENHIEQVSTQLAREPFPFPTLRLRKAASLFDYRLSDIEILDYRHHPRIKAPIAV